MRAGAASGAGGRRWFVSSRQLAVGSRQWAIDFHSRWWWGGGSASAMIVACCGALADASGWDALDVGEMFCCGEGALRCASRLTGWGLLGGELSSVGDWDLCLALSSLRQA